MNKINIQTNFLEVNSLRHAYDNQPVLMMLYLLSWFTSLKRMESQMLDRTSKKNLWITILFAIIVMSPNWQNSNWAVIS